jgi:integrase
MTRFLALTGWRDDDARNLCWRDIDTSSCLVKLPDSKSGPSLRPIAHAAMAILTSLDRGEASDRVFQSTRGENGLTGFYWTFKAIAKVGGLPDDLHPHIFRHSFMSIAADLEVPELGAATLTGQRKRGVTQSYIHQARDVLVGYADRVANSILERMGEAPASSPSARAKEIEDAVRLLKSQGFDVQPSMKG